MTGQMFVVTDEADGFDLPGDFTDTGQSGTYADGIDLGRRQVDFSRISGRFLSGINRYQIHSHRRLAGPGLAEVRVHGGDPIENFWSPRRIAVARVQIKALKKHPACHTCGKGDDAERGITSTHSNL